MFVLLHVWFNVLLYNLIQDLLSLLHEQYSVDVTVQLVHAQFLLADLARYLVAPLDKLIAVV